MARKRVNFQSEALYVSSNPSTAPHFEFRGTGVFSDTYFDATGANPALTTAILAQDEFDANVVNLVRQLTRIQNITYSIAFDKNSIHQHGELAAIDKIPTSAPVASLDFSYYLANFVNEGFLGFEVGGQISCLAHILNKTQDDKNYFIKTVSEGVDSVEFDGNQGESIGIGNGFITSYSSQASVGDYPTVDVSVEGYNISLYNGYSGKIVPSIDTETNSQYTGSTFHLDVTKSHPSGVIDGDLSLSVLRPGDIRLSAFKRTNDSANIANGDYDAPGIDINEACIQSYNLSFDISRETIECLGHRYPIDKSITPPVDVSLSIDSLVGDLNTGNFSDIFNCNDHYDIIIDLYRPTCVGPTSDKVVSYIMKDFTLDNINFSSDIGSNKTVTLEFMGTMGGPNMVTRGLFMSGIHIPSGVF